MAPKKDRTDYYNLKKLAKKMTFKNAQQKLMFEFKDVDFMKPVEIKELIKTLDIDHKETILWLKSKL